MDEAAAGFALAWSRGHFQVAEIGQPSARHVWKGLPLTRDTLCVVRLRTSRFALVGAVIVATAALVYERTLLFSEYVYRRRNGPWIRTPFRAHVLGFELSPTEAVAWFVILGALAGGLLGVALARVRQRKQTFMLVGSILGGVVGLIYSVSLDEVCIGGGDVFSCGYRSFFGWEIVPLASWALWTGIGAAFGGIVGPIAARVSRRT